MVFAVFCSYLCSDLVDNYRALQNNETYKHRLIDTLHLDHTLLSIVKKAEIKLPFGLNKENVPVHVREVVSGRKCDCVCPCCRAPLIAAKGTRLQFHFKHDPGNECVGALESAIHLAAKHILKERKQIRLPQYIAKVVGRDLKEDVYTEEKTVVTDGTIIKFDSVNDEVALDEIKVDILAEKSNTHLIIEIFHSHKVDDQKLQKIKSAKLSAIEINLSNLNTTDLDDWESFWTSINDPKRIKWLNNSKANLSVYPVLQKKLNQIIESKNRLLKPEIEEKQQRAKRAFEENKRILEKQKSDVLSAVKELKNLMSEDYKTQLKRKAETIGALDFNNRKIALSELPFYLNVDVPYGDWIFGCDKRIWQTAFFDAFICTGKKDVFSIEEVHEWLREKVNCRIPRAAVIIGKFGKFYSDLLPDLPDGYPSSWGALRIYFNFLWKLGVLNPLFEESRKKRSRYKIVNKEPFGRSRTMP